MRRPISLALLLLLAACNRNADAPDAPAGDPGPNVDPAALAELHLNIAETAARDEHDAERVTVEHVLISFDNKVPGGARSKDEAEALTAELLARIMAGEDFSAVRQEYSNDSGGGVYTMVATGPGNRPTTYARSGMVSAFGDVGWRLEVGQIGVAPYHPSKSGYGWHIIKRRE